MSRNLPVRAGRWMELLDLRLKLKYHHLLDHLPSFLSAGPWLQPSDLRFETRATSKQGRRGDHGL